MSAPLSPRSEAILDAVTTRPAGATVRAVVQLLDRTPPDPAWTSLSPGDRRATVRRYLGRLADDRRVIRLRDGVFLPVYLTRPAQDPPRTDNDRQITKQGMPDSDPRHNPEGPTMPDTPEPAEQTPPQGSADSQTGHNLRPLLDDCPLGPWPSTAYDALDVVGQLRARRDDLTEQRDTACRSADELTAELSEAIVDGQDVTALRASLTAHRQEADELDRALTALESRLHAATLAVLAAQDTDLTARAHAARETIHAHRQRTTDLLDELAEHDGDHWRDVHRAILGWWQRSTSTAQERSAERLADAVLALRATLSGVPLGFYGVSERDRRVSPGPLGTLTGAAGVPPLLEVVVHAGEEADSPEAHRLVEAFRQELAQTPVR